MKVLVTGGGGQLARALRRTAADGHELSMHSVETLDITNSGQVESVVNVERPDVIINTAAYTDVDGAETDRDAAAAVNGDGPGILADAAERHGSSLIHVSTDFVFDGSSSSPLKTDDPTNPISTYGQTKLDGESAIIDSALQRWTIVRTAWLYDETSPNFLSAMVRMMEANDEIRVVSDQTGTPTRSKSLAVALWCIAEGGVVGMHHWTDSGSTTWHGFATAIEEIGFESGLFASRTRVEPIASKDYPTSARRPAYSVLDKTDTWSALEGTRAMPAINWRENLERTIRERMRV